jgi:two-component system, OmpR family, sensor histidine kinase SenX3
MSTRSSRSEGGGQERATRADALASEREQLMQALAASSDAVVVVTADGTEIMRNEAAERFRDGRHGDALANEALTELLEHARRGIAGDRELQMFGPPREVLRVWSVPLIVRGVLAGAVAFVRDITEARRIESVRRDFVANVSHELKTPIGALALLAETMAAGGDEVLLQQLAERMAREADRLARIVDDLLDLSHIEAQEAPSREPVPVALLVNDALERVRSAAGARQIALVIGEIPPELTVMCDRNQLVSAISNLVDNAIKYSDPGSPVEVRSVSDGDLVVIEVCDQGIGIPSRDLERIFERFYRVDRARSRATGGTGLGLSIVRHVAQVHGGDVMVESREGVGSTFRLRLPADPGTRPLLLMQEEAPDG